MFLKISERDRERLRKPLGILLPYDFKRNIEILKKYLRLHKPSMIISVGDVVTANLLRQNITPKVAIVDFKTLRSIVPNEIKEFIARAFTNILKCKNPRGCITYEAYNTLKRAINSSGNTLVIVDGEEDLLTLAAITLAPENSVIIYGQPGTGMVLVFASREKKDKIRRLIDEIRRSYNVGKGT